MTWDDQKILVVVILGLALFILLDELAFYSWKKANPGTLYSHLFKKSNLSILDPSRPPTTVYYE